jgi:hypothetical protein
MTMTMVEVYMTSDGDIAADCDRCHETQFIPIQILIANAGHVNEVIGEMVSNMISHVMDMHGGFL